MDGTTDRCVVSDANRCKTQSVDETTSSYECKNECFMNNFEEGIEFTSSSAPSSKVFQDLHKFQIY